MDFRRSSAVSIVLVVQSIKLVIDFNLIDSAFSVAAAVISPNDRVVPGDNGKGGVSRT